MAKQIGDYDLIQKLEADEITVKYKATQRSMNRTVTVSALRPEVARDHQKARDFLAEARGAAHIQNPNALRVYEAGQDKGVYFVSTEHADGPSLETFLRQRGRIDASRATAMLEQAADALQAVYEEGIVHGDVRPAHLHLNSGSDAVRLGGIGVMRPKHDLIGQQELGLAAAPYYMPPELGKGLRSDTRSDIYSLGATFYHALAGTPPFTGPHATAVLMKHAGETATPLSTLDPAIPKQLSDVIDRMMAKSPDERFKQPKEVVAALKIQAEPVIVAPTKRRANVVTRNQAPPPPGMRKPGTVKFAPKVSTRNRPLVYAAGGGGVVLIIIFSLLMFGSEGPVVEGAPQELREARELIAAGTIASLDEASERCRNLIKRLPTSSRGIEIATEVERVRDRAEHDFLKLVDRDIQDAVISARKGKTSTSDVLEKLGKLRERYARPGIPSRFTQRAAKLLEWGENFLMAGGTDEAKPDEAAVAEAPPLLEEMVEEAVDVPAPGPTLSPTTATLLAEVPDFIDRGDFKGAITIIQAVLASAETGHDREVARAKRKEILNAAQAAYDRLSLKVGTDLDLGKLETAKSSFQSAREGLDFPPYAKLLALLGKRIDSRMPAPVEDGTQGPATEAERDDQEPPPEDEKEEVADEEPEKERPKAPPVDEKTAESEIAKALVKAMSLLQNGSYGQVIRLLDDVEYKYGATKAYENKKRQLDSIRTMAEAG